MSKPAKTRLTLARNKIESNTFFLIGFVFVEASVDPFLYTFGNVASYLAIEVEYVANCGAGNLRRGEYFFTFVLA